MLAVLLPFIHAGIPLIWSINGKLFFLQDGGQIKGTVSRD
jgi:hypothetical protein